LILNSEEPHQCSLLKLYNNVLTHLPRYLIFTLGCLKGREIVLDEDDIRLKRKGTNTINQCCGAGASWMNIYAFKKHENCLKP
jgi:hypothetical protein